MCSYSTRHLLPIKGPPIDTGIKNEALELVVDFVDLVDGNDTKTLEGLLPNVVGSIAVLDRGQGVSDLDGDVVAVLEVLLELCLDGIDELLVREVIGKNGGAGSDAGEGASGAASAGNANTANRNRPNMGLMGGEKMLDGVPTVLDDTTRMLNKESVHGRECVG